MREKFRDRYTWLGSFNPAFSAQRRKIPRCFSPGVLLHLPRAWQINLGPFWTSTVRIFVCPSNVSTSNVQIEQTPPAKSARRLPRNASSSDPPRRARLGAEQFGNRPDFQIAAALSSFNKLEWIDLRPRPVGFRLLRFRQRAMPRLDLPQQ